MPNNILKEIIDKAAALSIYEKRSTEDAYCELVILNKEIDAWNKILTDMLGAPLKPLAAKPTEEDNRLTKDYGGVCDNQTLFKREVGNTVIIAMLWPWGDKIHTTLKLMIV